MTDLRSQLILAEHVPPAKTWPYLFFQPHELRCRHCGLLLHDHEAVTKLDRMRATLGMPIIVQSGFRCAIHNAAVGGAAGSFHLQGRAFDLRCAPGLRPAYFEAARSAGFTGFGTYDTFVHVDDGPKRSWNG